MKISKLELNLYFRIRDIGQAVGRADAGSKVTQCAGKRDTRCVLEPLIVL
jgi:hypothetical protein